MSVKILLVDDHQVFSTSLKLVLEANSYEVDIATHVNLAISFLKANSYDLLISDIEMPEINGVDFIKIIHKNKSNFKKTPKIIVLTSYHKIALFKKLHVLGIDGFLSKNTSQFELLKAIRNVLANEKYYETSIYNSYLKSNLNNQSIDFTDRELDVLKLILEEKTTSEIALELQISKYTVEGHRKNLLQKTNSKNVVGLIKYSLLNNLF
ncbi:response regulator [Pseudofulvibacter geojedonensis]|uniref:Response regulator n=1 Tax=Pseudofulvibacter geojedonensis TaxID=1123758 RepID=A0ABW3I5G5_9FLAO